MQCPITSERWQQYQDTGDSQVANHLASCDICRAEAERYAHLQQSLAHLHMPEMPKDLMTRIDSLAMATAAQSFTCEQTLTVLDSWREGELDAAQSFLIEDHLLWCPTCAEALAQADLLSTVLRTLPVLEAPAAIAERIELARVPWWKRLLPTPAPSLVRQFQFAGSLAAGLVLALTSTLLMPRIAQTPAGDPSLRQVIIAKETLPETPSATVVRPIPVTPVTTPRPNPQPTVTVTIGGPAQGSDSATAQPVVENVENVEVATWNPEDYSVSRLPDEVTTDIADRPEIYIERPAETPAIIAKSDPAVDSSAYYEMVRAAQSEHLARYDDSYEAAARMIGSGSGTKGTASAGYTL